MREGGKLLAFAAYLFAAAVVSSVAVSTALAGEPGTRGKVSNVGKPTWDKVGQPWHYEVARRNKFGFLTIQVLENIRIELPIIREDNPDIACDVTATTDGVLKFIVWAKRGPVYILQETRDLQGRPEIHGFDGHWTGSHFVISLTPAWAPQELYEDVRYSILRIDAHKHKPQPLVLRDADSLVAWIDRPHKPTENGWEGLGGIEYSSAGMRGLQELGSCVFSRACLIADLEKRHKSLLWLWTTFELAYFRPAKAAKMRDVANGQLIGQENIKFPYPDDQWGRNTAMVPSVRDWVRKAKDLGDFPVGGVYDDRCGGIVPIDRCRKWAAAPVNDSPTRRAAIGGVPLGYALHLQADGVCRVSVAFPYLKLNARPKQGKD